MCGEASNVATTRIAASQAAPPNQAPAGSTATDNAISAKTKLEFALKTAIQNGAAGYVLKEVEGDSLLGSVRAVASGHSLIDPAMARRVIAWMEHAFK